MNFYIKPHPYLAHWVPGFFVSVAVLLRHYDWSYQRLMEYMPASQTKSFLVGLAIVVVAWIAGQALGAVRDILEHALDRVRRIEWDFFFWAEPSELEKFEEQYFLSYVFCFNMAIALAGMLLLSATRSGFPPKAIAAGELLFVFFVVDTVLLRAEIGRVLGDWSRRSQRSGRQLPR